MEHLTREELEGYGGGVGAAVLLAADQHLAECPACRRELRRLKGAPALPVEVLEMAEPVHLTYEEMSGFVDSSLPEHARERVDQHMHLCRSCATEVRGLEAFDARLALELAVPVEAKEPQGSRLVQGREALGRFLTQFWQTPQRLRLAGAGVGLMVLGVMSLIQFPAAGGVSRDGSAAAAHMTMLSVAVHPHLFYGGFLIAGCGAAALLYGLFKR